MKRFLASESEMPDTQDAFDETNEVTLDDTITSMVLESEQALYDEAIDTIIELEGEEMREDAVQFMGLQPSEEAYDDVKNAEQKGDWFQELLDDVAEFRGDVVKTVANPVSNFFTGVNRTLSKTDKLLNEVRSLDNKSHEKSYSRKASAKLLIGGSQAGSIKELTEAVKELTKLGEWIAKDYTDGLHEYFVTFINAARNPKNNKFFDRERIVDEIVNELRKVKYPVPKGAKKVGSHNRNYDTYSTGGILGGKEFRSQVLDFSRVQGENFEKLNAISGQVSNIVNFEGRSSSDRITFDMPTKKELEELLKATEDLVSVAKHISNDIRQHTWLKTTDRAANSLVDAWDALLASVPTYGQIAAIRYVITGVRRSLLRFINMNSKAMYTTYGGYISNAYQVGEAINKLVADIIKRY